MSPTLTTGGVEEKHTQTLLLQVELRRIHGARAEQLPLAWFGKVLLASSRERLHFDFNLIDRRRIRTF